MGCFFLKFSFSGDGQLKGKELRLKWMWLKKGLPLCSCMIYANLNIHKIERLYYECEISQFDWNIKKDYIVFPASLTYFEMICFAFNFKFSCSRGIKLLTFEFRFRGG